MTWQHIVVIGIEALAMAFLIRRLRGRPSRGRARVDVPVGSLLRKARRGS